MKITLSIKSIENKGRSFQIHEYGDENAIVQPINEEDLITIEACLPKGSHNVQLLFSDISLPSVSQKETDNSLICQWVPQRRNNRPIPFFENLFGTCFLSLQFVENGVDKFIKFTPIEIFGNKLSRDSAIEMISYICGFSHGIIEAPISVVKYTSGLSHQHNAITKYIDEAEKGILFIEKISPYLINNPCTRLIPLKKIVQYSNEHPADTISIDWIVDNLHLLGNDQGDPNNTVKIGVKKYSLEKVEVSTLMEGSDVYENQVIMSYISNIITFLTSFNNNTKSFNNEIGNKEPIRLSEMVKRHSRKKIIQSYSKAKHLLEKVSYLESVLKKRMKVSRQAFGTPIITSKVKARSHYRLLFEHIISWYNLGSPNWNEVDSFINIKTLDELYEIFCLFQIHEALTLNGYVLVDKQNSLFFAGFTDENIRTPFSFVKKGVNITVHYEKKFWMKGNINTIEQDFCNIEAWGNHGNDLIPRSKKHARSHRCPDFTLVVSTDKLERLIIFDAKYSTPSKAMKYYLKEACMKYFFGIASTFTAGYPTSALFLLTPPNKNNIDILNSYTNKEYGPYGKYPSLPFLGTISLSSKTSTEFPEILGHLIKQVLAST